MFKLFEKITKKEIPILMYHRIINKDADKGVHTIYYNEKLFEEQLKYLKEKKYTTITFYDLKNLSKEDRKKGKYIILTFDDGYEDNYLLLFPLLKKYKMKAVIYMVSHLEYNVWDVEESNEKKFNLMTNEQIIEMHSSGLVEFGGHTLHHVKLNTLSEEEQRREILENKIFLEDLLSIKLVSFAYPYGYFNDISKKILKEVGYEYGLATDSGPFYIEDDLYEIRRIGIFPSVNMRKFKRRVKGNYNIKKL